MMSTRDYEVLAERPSKVVYRDGDTVVKMFDDGYSKADILNESLNQARVEETGLNIPKLLEVMKIDGKWAIRTEYISGSTMQQLYDSSPEQRVDIIDRFIGLQMLVHSKQAPLLNKLKDKMDRKINETTLDPNIKYELHTALEGMPRHRKVCHGDFNLSNIIISDKDGTPYIIDWAHATQGNASADVARTYLLFSLTGDMFLANGYLDRYCEKSGTPKRYVQKWLPIVAAAQSVKGRPEEREFLLSWVNVVDYE